MKKQDFTTTILVDQSPKEAFDAINNVRGWWTGEIDGTTDKLDNEFSYRFKDLHYSKHKLIEAIPGEKIVWLITESSINFVKDKNEWRGTKIIFDIALAGDKTQIRFTHHGLVPAQECYDACSNAWTGYITDSLRKFIAGNSNFTIAILVDQTPQEAFNAINNVRGWWSENIEGRTDKLNSTFDYHYKDVHRCKIKIVELVPAQKVVWQVMDNYFKFTEDKTEWINTRIVFDIALAGDKTEIRFTHQGLVPAYECYELCNEAWTYYIGASLRQLIATGKGGPTLKDGADAAHG